ncbi:uncharacterized protein LOC129564945 [Sitodiplosis mosellana]|uniref:uncharacterized protein LOC129564945 n=1 Tax=Sitodiplosis mosellana TaxID=263140 RepID=UPI0024438F07|nr:uncharacterized protein LOC129564945 [Sitodiplosis mosellana]
MLKIRRLLILCGIVFYAEGTRVCPEATKAHLTRCDMYYKCSVMKSDNIIWLAQNCPNGLVYDSNYGNCVLPGDDWECQLDTESRSSSRADDDNVYGVNNLSYLKDQIKGYETEVDGDGDETRESTEGEELTDDNEDVLITMSNNGTVSFESGPTSNSSENEFESSGDGEDEDELENKSTYIPIPNNSDGLVSSQLQRLSQLVRKVNNNQNDDLTTDDLNQYLSLHKLVHQKFPSHTKAERVPHNKLIEDHHLKQILDLQKKLNNLGNTRNTYSTPPTPVKVTVNGNGVYPADATTVHIKATNALKHPRFPDAGYSSSQIVVNRPGGSVVFRLPHSGSSQKEPTNKKKQESQISEETLKTLLELTKHMTNQAPNTPNFVHSLPSATNGDYAQPIIQPVLYNFPWDQMSLASLFEILNSKKGNIVQNEKKGESMEKIASTSFSVPTTPNAASEPDDTSQTTIVHNHIPITIAHPSPTNSIINRFQPVTTTARPFQDRYDSYGYKKPAEHTDLKNYYSYPPYSENLHKDPVMQQIPSASGTMYKSPFSTQPTAYDANVEQPQYIQIAQSRPDNYIPVYPSSNVIEIDGMRPIPTFASVNGGYTRKFYSTYAPQPHLSENNVNKVVHINQKPYPTMRPAVNYVPIATASSPTPSYAELPPEYGPVQKHPNIADKIDQFIDANENDDDAADGGGGGGDNERYENNDEYVNTNVEQSSNENVMNLLANYNSRLKSNSMESITNMDDTQSVSDEKKSTHKYKTNQSQGNHKQFVNLNGNFMSLETYQQTIEPYLQKNSIIDSQIEVLTCATGVRQANSSDCTRYFVCNEKTGKVLSYPCPPYTAFNGDTKICNAETYARCFSGSSTKNHEKLAQGSLQMSILEANRIKAEAVKAQQLAHLIKLETDKILSAAHQVRYKQQMPNGGKSTVQVIPPTRPSQIIQQRPNQIPQQQPHRKQQIIQTNKITPQKSTVKNTTLRVKKPQGKRKIPCRTEGKLVDNLSQHHYFLCFKDPTQVMRARRLHCPAKLIFCPSTLVCTATERCPNKFNRM